MAPYRPMVKAAATVRFETPPGKQAQVDMATSLLGGGLLRITGYLRRGEPGDPLALAFHANGEAIRIVCVSATNRSEARVECEI